jgi:hypothetical protein
VNAKDEPLNDNEQKKRTTELAEAKKREADEKKK